MFLGGERDGGKDGEEGEGEVGGGEEAKRERERESVVVLRQEETWLPSHSSFFPFLTSLSLIPSLHVTV